MPKRTNQTARAAMKLAHSIKSQFTTFAQALKAAWAQIKKPVKTIVERLIEMGGKRWTKSETLDRVYFKPEQILEILGYSASGSRITAENQGKKFFAHGRKKFFADTFFYDVAKSEFRFSGWTDVEEEFKSII